MNVNGRARAQEWCSTSFIFKESRDMSGSLSRDGQIEALNCIQSPLGRGSKHFCGNPPHCAEEPHVTSNCKPHQKRGVCTIQRPWPVAVISVKPLTVGRRHFVSSEFTMYRCALDVHPVCTSSIGDVLRHWHVNAKLDAITCYWTASKCGLRGGT